MKRRADDPEEFDAAPLRVKNGGGVAFRWGTKEIAIRGTHTLVVALLGFLLVYALGALAPLGLRSPLLGNGRATAMVGAEKKLDALAGALQTHHAASVENQRVYRLICRGVWKGNPEMQDNCEGLR